MKTQHSTWHRLTGYLTIILMVFGISAGTRATTPHTAYAATVGTAPTWTPIGPIPGAQANGRVLTFAVDPAGKLYLGGPGGVWTSTNNGTSWSTSTDQQAGIDVGAIAIDPNKLANPSDPANPYAIYAGTGDYGGVTALPGEGVLKSMDGGATWTQQNPNGMLTGTHTTALAIDPRGSVLYLATTQGIFVSKDGGTTFPTTILAGQTVTALVLDPSTNPTTVFAAVQGVGIERSVDGTQFTVLAGGLPDGTQFGRTALAIAPSNGKILYASVGQPNAPSALTGIYKSVDGGSTWNQLTLSPDFTMYSYAQGNVSSGQSFADNVLAVSPTDPNIVYGAGVGLAKSIDGGTTWTNLSDPNAATSGLGGDFHSLTFDGRGNLFVGSDTGIAEQTKAGQIVNLNANLNAILFYPGISQVGNGSTITAGAQDNAIWVYSGTPAWRVGLNADGFETGIDPLNPNVMYGTTNDGIFKTTDQWQTTQVKINPPTVPAGSGPWVKQMALAPITATPDSPTVYFGSDKVYTSQDGGTTWNNGTNAYTLPGSFNGVSALAVAPSKPSVVYAGFTDGTMQVSVDRGVTWTTLAPPSGAPNCNTCVGMWISHITVDPTNESNVAVTLGGTAFPHTDKAPPHVIQGANAETAAPTWTEVTGNLPNDAANSVIYSGSGLIVGTDKGVYTGAPPTAGNPTWNWVPTAAGLPRAPVHDLSLTPNGTLIALTFGRGAWTTTVPTISPNGTGTMTVAPALVKAGSTGLTETFTYTAGDGGLNNGEVDLSIPGGWTAPTAANSTASTGTLAVMGQTITVTGVTLPAAGTMTITYGQGGAVTAPATLGANTFVTRTWSGITPPLTPLGVQAQITTTVTGGTMPAAPTGVVTTPGTPGVCTDGTGAVSVSWNAPPFDGGSPVTKYSVTLNPGGGSLDVTAPATSVQNICGQDKTKAYTATVTATNANGTGPTSAPSGAITPATVPPAPGDVNLIRGNGEVAVMWQPPAGDNGAPITGYTITAQPGNESMTVSPDDRSATLTGLSNGTNYAISVTADNQYGTGAADNAAQPVDPSAAANIPDPPTDLTVATGAGQATVSWTAPSDNGSPILYYTVRAEPGGRTITVNGSYTSATFTGLSDGTAYTFTVAASNALGWGPASMPSDGNQGGLDQGGGAVVGTVPGAPTSVRAAAGNAQATISWKPPLFDGGFELTRYLVVATPGGRHTEVDASQTGATISGLSNGTAYTFRVTAFSAFGAGMPSAASSAVTPQSCTTISGRQTSSTLGAGRWCLSGTFQGSISIGHGATVSILGATITGGITATGAATIRVCGSLVGGPIKIANTSGFVLIGDSTDDDCAGNTLHSVSLLSNYGGLDFQDNTQAQTSAVVISHNSGTGPAEDDGAPEIGNNGVTGVLTCTANTPAPTDDERPNYVLAGTLSGQCAGL